MLICKKLYKLKHKHNLSNKLYFVKNYKSWEKNYIK